MVSPVFGNKPTVRILKRSAIYPNGQRKVITLTQENKRLTSATITRIGKDGKEYAECDYKIGNNAGSMFLIESIKEKIKKTCEKAKDGSKLFADIMGWLK